MDLQISRALLPFIVFAAVPRISGASNDNYRSAQDSHWCYECKDLGKSCLERPVICPIGFSNCMSTTNVVQIGDTHTKMKQKECIEDCQDGSMNLGISQLSFSCCSAHLCNSRDPPDPKANAPNGRTCHYCDGQSCSNNISCSGTEDRCITATATDRGLPTLVKGCGSQYFCGARKWSFIQDVSCCEGDLCNADDAQAFTQSTRATSEEDAKNVTERLTYNFAKRKFSFKSFNYKRFNYRSSYNSAKSVKQSFLFLCCSLLFLRL
ncbi:hypothetical protein QQF64_000412 [Cirrhinus molitorella]|uniref:UPAR/Ly6 domain-containing protein n=1 Tax=Cirrhinus molitorella TaxID=172907 RepID=A0ABR3NX36_9TELE